MRFLIIILVLLFCAAGQCVSVKRRMIAVENRLTALEMRVLTDNELSRDAYAGLEDIIEEFNVSLKLLVSTVSKVDTIENVKYGNSKPVQPSGCPNVGFSLSGFSAEKKWVRQQLVQLTNKLSDLQIHVEDHISYITTEMKMNAEKLDETGELYETMCQNSARKLHTDFTIHKNEINSLWIEENERMLELFQTEIKKRDYLIENQANDIQNLQNNVEFLNSTLKRLTDFPNNNVQQKISSQCLDGWRKFGNFCYFHDDNGRKDYKSARAKCSTYNAHVADVESDAEEDFIAEVVGSTAFWIGITDEVAEGVWISDRTGKPTVYTNLVGSQSNTWRDNCAFMIATKLWFGTLCTTSFQYVCKKPL